jgi:L-asparaginase II
MGHGVDSLASLGQNLYRRLLQGASVKAGAHSKSGASFFGVHRKLAQMVNPVMVQVKRGRVPDVVHRGRWVVVNNSGRLLESGGDCDQLMLPRSALKLIQAIPMVQSGAVERFRLTERHLALTCASHSSEEAQVKGVLEILSNAGCTEDCLGCGPHWPAFREIDFAGLAAAGKYPTKAYNQCSGKHSGFLCAVRARGETTRNYLSIDHPVQQLVLELVSKLSKADIGEDQIAIDGCSAPTFAMSLYNFAEAFRAVNSGEFSEIDVMSAARKLLQASVNEAYFVGGTDRVCSDIMIASKGRVYAKMGADGAYVAMLLEEGITIALKCDDGSRLAAETALAGLLRRHVVTSDASFGDLVARLCSRPVLDRNGTQVGTCFSAL